MIVYTGAIYSPDDKRDYTLDVAGISIGPVLPAKVTYLPAVYSQYMTSQCVAYSLAGYREAAHLKATGTQVNFSKQAIYGNRLTSYHTGEGMITRDAVKAFCKYGTVPIGDFIGGDTAPECINAFERQKENLLTKAYAYRGKTYFRLFTAADISTFMRMFNLPVILVFDVYWNSWGTENGFVKEPDIVGYPHCVLGTEVFIKDEQTYVTILNSWGDLWGLQGYGYLKAERINEAWGIVDFDPVLVRKDVDTIVIDTMKQTLTAYADKESIAKPTSVVNVDGRIHLQMRDIFETLGWEQIRWDNYSKVATFKKYRSGL